MPTPKPSIPIPCPSPSLYTPPKMSLQSRPHRGIFHHSRTQPTPPNQSPKLRPRPAPRRVSTASPPTMHAIYR